MARKLLLNPLFYENPPKLMMEASLIAYSRQRDLFKKLEAVSNNVSNSETAGFKADLAVFESKNKPSLPHPTMVFATDLSQGAFKATEKPPDVAIQGNGFFQVQTPLGARFTRSGNFFTDQEGNLITAEGYFLQSDGGNVTIPPEDTEIKISDNGEIYGVTAQGLELRGTISVFKFDDIENLEKVGNSYFKSDATPATAEYKTDYTLAQGMLEGSNTNSVEQITHLIDINRNVQNLGKIINDQNQLLRSAVQKITGTN